VLALGETVTAAAIAGIALVLAGVALTRRKPKTEEAVGGAGG
jgi:LPXTG-motif cell wall-anchored protein